ncbi:STAS domain-containing protein [Kutzneria buriramensis]|uniref:Anti-sigma factor antagonist n=1 Tax=Kutzneria buriramensis TaxID=1045776 RepID=A0A3E0H7E0_9PSEU|nr:STAS domain-containing protein [Kutzneria buriramensis]REH39362.1 anti-anti-sigma factor [Kutzneria buriramensis]
MTDSEGLSDADAAAARMHDGDMDTAVVVRLVGEIDLATAEHAAEQLRAAEAVAVAAPPAVVVLDLSQVTFLGSVGLAILVEHDQLCAALGSRLCVVVGDNQRVWRPIQVAALDGVITIVANIAAAARWPAR